MTGPNLETRIYYFACNFLWVALSLFHYLEEEMSQDIGLLYVEKWGNSFDNLAHWALEERYFPLYIDKMTKQEEDLLSSKVETHGNLLISNLADELRNMAKNTYKKQPSLSEVMWLYYYYCSFLRQTLTEFDRVLQEQDRSQMYYKHYQQDTSLFNELAKALEKERPFVDPKPKVSETTVQTIWEDIDTFASKLGAKWQQAVHSAARDLELPDSFKNTA